MVDFLTTLVVILFWIFCAVRWIRVFRGDERALLWVSFLAHQIAGIVNIWVTKFYYQWGDMMSYYHFGVVAADRLREDFWGLAPNFIGLLAHQPNALAIPLPIEAQPGNTGAIQAVSAFAMYLLNDSLYAACALIAGASFLSKVCLYKIAIAEFPNLPRRPMLVACTMLPSALFWSCSLIKESLAMLGLLGGLYGWFQIMNGGPRIRSVLLIGVSSAVVLCIKGYIFPAAVLAIGAWHVVRKVRERHGDVTFKVGHVIVAAVVGALLVVVTGFLLPRFGADALGDQLANLQAVGDTVEGGSYYSLGQNSGSPANQAALAPFGLVTALFRPVLFEAKTPIVAGSAVEMSFFLGGSILLMFRRGVLSCFSEIFRRPFLAFCVIFVVIFGTCVGLGTTNLGTLSRYRMPLTPFFAILLLALIARAPEPVRVARAPQRRAGLTGQPS